MSTVVFPKAVGSCLDKCCEPQESRRKVRILLVEDNPMDVLLLTKLIADQGGMVTVCRTIAELKKIDLNSFDFALMALSLPDSVSEETLQVVKDMPIPRVVITGRCYPDVAYAAGRMGVPVIIKHSGNMDCEMIARNVMGMAEAYAEQNHELEELRVILKARTEPR